MGNIRKIYSKIYDRYVAKIYRFIFLKVSSREVAEDLTSETFTRVWKKMSAADNNPGPEIKNVSAFLYGVARNLVVDHYREKGKVQFVSTENVSIIDPEQDLQKQAFLKSDVAHISQALSNLNDDYQNVIIWRYLDDLPITEIALLLDRTEDATRVLLHRALKSLRSVINKNEVKEV